MTKTLATLGIYVLFTHISLAQDNPFSTKWDNGFKVQNADKSMKLKFGGRIMWDNAFFFQDDSLEAHYGKLNNGTEFRRVRFFSSGTIYSNVDYKLQLEFSSGAVVFKDVFITLKKLPVVGNLRVGHFKEPLRLEILTSSKNMTFMERGFTADFLTERNTGFMLFNDFFDKRLSVQSGFFRRGNDVGNDKAADDGYAITSRIAGLPIRNEDGSEYLHLGAGFSYRKPESRTYKSVAKPEAHMGKKYVSTGTIEDVSQVNILSFEAAWVHGPLSLIGEYTQTNVSVGSPVSVTHNFSAYYGEVAFFLTGEHKTYKKSMDAFDRVKPNNNWGENGAGAWQVALRYSSIDLNSGDPVNGGVAGGEMADITAGINWYLNPSIRIFFNYVVAQVKGEGNASIVQMRFSLDF